MSGTSGGGLPSSSASAGAVVPISGGSNGGLPDDMDFTSLPPEYKKEGSDWFAVFNPKAKRALDVSLVHTLTHERCVFWLGFFFELLLMMYSVWFAVCAFQRMGNSWRRGVIERHRSMIQRRARRLGALI